MRLLRRLANQLDSDGLPVREVPHDDQLFALLASTVSYRAAFWAVAACVLAAAVWQLMAPSSPRR